jgi:outer membrane immunogenic protein
MPTVSESRSRRSYRGKRISGLLALLLSSTSGALAADMPYLQKMPPIPALAPQNWTGFYLGIQGGYAFGKDRLHEYFTANGASTGLEFHYDVKGWLGGAHLGYNKQFGNIVAGVEADIELARLRGGFFDPPAPPLNPGGSGTTEIDWQGSLRGRLGYAFDSLLVYGTVGLAFAKIDHLYSNQTTQVYEATGKLRTGWTAGFGLEYSLTPSMTTRIEYRYTEISDYFYASQTAFPGLLTGQQSPRFHTTRLGLSYRF